MPKSCVAFGCKSGYRSNRDIDKSLKVSFHSFPLHDKVLCDKWKRANPRKDFEPTEYSVMCSLHFKDCDFVTESKDSNPRRKKNRTEGKLCRRYLKDDAVPCIFQKVPGYLSSTGEQSKRSLSTSSTSRLARENDRLQQLIDEFEAWDSIKDMSLAEIEAKLAADNAMPQGFKTTLNDNILYMFLLHFVDGAAVVRASISLNEDSVVAVFVNGKQFPQESNS